jgi:adenylate cyclase
LKWADITRPRHGLSAALGIGLLVGLVGVLINPWPGMFRLETSLGLDWLFTLRGPRAAPADVAVVAIDDQTSRSLGIPIDTADWNRDLHARLVRRLHELGAAVIVFDMAFDDRRDAEGDRAFAAALEESGRVVLFQRLTRPRLSELGSDDRALTDRLRPERLAPIIEPLASRAAGIGPFPLPKVPVRVNRFWTFKRGAGDVPTLPVLALHAFARDTLDRYRRLIDEPDPENRLPHTGRPLPAETFRQRLLGDPERAESLRADLIREPGSLSVRDADLMLALLDVHTGPAHRYFDFYGPAQTLITHSYQDVLAGNVPPMQGKAVFIGASSQYQPVQQDAFYTVFSRKDGTDLGGVEIAATAFANLLERRQISPLPPLPESLLLLGWGILLGLTLRLPPLAFALGGTAVAAMAYPAAAYRLFSDSGLWWPLITPLVIQLPLAVGLTLYQRYARSQQDRAALQRTFSRYLPPAVVRELADHPDEHSPESRIVNGVCLATDAQRYTSLAERMSPRELRGLLNRYFGVLFEPVERRGGFVSDVVGDAMVALWVTTRLDSECRRQACLAALEMVDGVERFNRESAATPLPTRVGIHCGDVALGDVGAGSHYEYRAVGDMINTASRLEGLNKQLGTWVLASAQVVDAVGDLHVRAVGSFRVVGRHGPVDVYEVLGAGRPEDGGRGAADQAFDTGLAAVQLGDWRQAETAFRAVLADDVNDGPARFYLDLAQAYQASPPPGDWDGVITLGSK